MKPNNTGLASNLDNFENNETETSFNFVHHDFFHCRTCGKRSSRRSIIRAGGLRAGAEASHDRRRNHAAAGVQVILHRRRFVHRYVV